MTRSGGIAQELIALYEGYDHLRRQTDLPLATVPGIALPAATRVARRRFVGSRAEMLDMLNRVSMQRHLTAHEVHTLAQRLVGRRPETLPIAPASIPAQLTAPFLTLHQRIVDVELEILRASLRGQSRSSLIGVTGQPPEVSVALHFLLPIGDSLRLAAGSDGNNIFPWQFIEPQKSPMLWELQARVIDTVFRLEALNQTPDLDRSWELRLMGQHRAWHQLVLSRPTPELVQRLRPTDVGGFTDRLIEQLLSGASADPVEHRFDAAETNTLLAARTFVEESRYFARLCHDAGVEFDDSFVPPSMLCDELGDPGELTLPPPGTSPQHDQVYACVIATAAAESAILHGHRRTAGLDDLRPSDNFYLSL